MLRLICICLALLATGAQAAPVDDIISHCIQAHGGLDKLKSVQTLRIKGKLMAGSFRSDFLQQYKRPDKAREETIIQGLVQIQAYDGRVGWQVNPFGGRKDPDLLSQDDLKSLVEDADIDGPLVDYQAKGHRAELLGHDDVEGTDCYKIRLNLKDGNIRTYYLDADSYLELKMEVQNTVRGTVQESEEYFGDYEQVNGIFYAFAYEWGQKGQQDRSHFTIDKLEINVPLADTLFTMPGGAK